VTIGELMLCIMRGPPGTTSNISNALYHRGERSPDYQEASAYMMFSWVALVAALEAIISVKCEL